MNQSLRICVLRIPTMFLVCVVKVSIEDNGHVSAICANDRLLAIGRDDGIACLYTFQLKVNEKAVVPEYERLILNLISRKFGH